MNFDGDFGAQQQWIRLSKLGALASDSFARKGCPDQAFHTGETGFSFHGKKESRLVPPHFLPAETINVDAVNQQCSVFPAGFPEDFGQRAERDVFQVWDDQLNLVFTDRAVKIQL